MPTPDQKHPTQPIGNTILVVMMDVNPAHEDEFNRWYNEEHLTERLEIPGYISARRFKLEEGEGVLKYLCIWELQDGTATTIRPNNSVRANSETASTLTSSNGCAACTRRFIPLRGHSRITPVSTRRSHRKHSPRGSPGLVFY